MISDRLLRLLFAVWGIAHLAFGIAGAAFPRWFFGVVPPWPPLHVGQIQIGGVFDLTMATAFLIAATDVARYAVLMIAVGIVAEWGHALVRIGHIVAGDDPPADLGPPLLMLMFGAILAVAGGGRLRARRDHQR